MVLPFGLQKDNFLTLPVDALWKYVTSAWKALKMVKNISIGHQMLSVACFCRVLGVELDLRSKPPSQSMHNVERKKNSLAFLRILGFFGAIYRLKKQVVRSPDIPSAGVALPLLFHATDDLNKP